ncbi:AarF/ABC1/UbiB kinase family protein [Marihabitans asiaticum]|nr:AarF/ABC1/UbiB kinase family protein [Marihabitans asiaticum]
MSEIPRNAARRTARLASLPLGAASRSAIGLSRRARGESAESVNEDLRRRTAEQLFTVLGSLKGGAMKVGQTLSVLEAAMPEDLVQPYREMLVQLQDAAPPMSYSTVTDILDRQLGSGWERTMVRDLSERPVAAASIGQVHRGTWSDGRTVAVKVQYPGADSALRSDLQQLARLARVMGSFVSGLDIKSVTDELLERADEELDYALEAENQRVFARAYRGDPDVAVPDVVAQTEHVLVSEWLDGSPLSQVIREGSQEVRDAVGALYLEMAASSPARCGMLQADPHPGNFRLTPDGRLGVLDFGAVNRLPDGFPPRIGPLVSLALRGEAEALVDGLRAEGFIRQGVSVDPDRMLRYLRPFVEPLGKASHHFTREWLREVSAPLTDPRTEEFLTGAKFNLPPEYVLIHRVFLGNTAVLSQLEARVGAREIFERHLPGFAPPPL